jgi:hypothetical protein
MNKTPNQNKLTPEDIIKIVWGDNDRKIAGNLFIKGIKKLKNHFYKENELGDIRYSKETIILELREHDISFKDIQLIRQLVSDVFKSEIFEIRKKYIIPPADVCYTDVTFSRHSLICVVAPYIIKQMNDNAKSTAIKELIRNRNYLQYYRDY